MLSKPMPGPGVTLIAAMSLISVAAAATGPTAYADSGSGAFIQDARAMGFTGSDQNLLSMGSIICSQLRQGVPESFLAEAIAGYQGPSAPATMPSVSTVVIVIHSARRYLCPAPGGGPSCRLTPSDPANLPWCG